MLLKLNSELLNFEDSRGIVSRILSINFQLCDREKEVCYRGNRAFRDLLTAENSFSLSDIPAQKSGLQQVS